MDWFCQWASLSRDVGIPGSPDFFDIQVVRQPVTSPAHEKTDSPFFRYKMAINESRKTKGGRSRSEMDVGPLGQALGILWILWPRHGLAFIHTAPHKVCQSIVAQKRGSGWWSPPIDLSQNLRNWGFISHFIIADSDGKAYHLHVHRVAWWI